MLTAIIDSCRGILASLSKPILSDLLTETVALSRISPECTKDMQKMPFPAPPTLVSRPVVEGIGVLCGVRSSISTIAYHIYAPNIAWIQ